MPLSMNDFINQAKGEVDFLFDSYSYTQPSKDLAFAQWVLQLLFPSIDPDEAFNLLVFDNTWNISARYRDDNSAVFYLLHARYSEHPEENRLGPGVIYSLLDILKRIESDAMGLSDSCPVISEAIKAKEEGYSISLIFSLFGEIDASVDIAKIEDQYEIGRHAFIACDLHQLRRLTAGMQIEDTLETQPVTLPFLSYADYAGPVEALVGNVAASDLKKSLQGIPEIYDVNLRVPLGLTKVNKQMNETLSSDNGRRFFWYYNNGITMLCRSFSPVDGQPNTYLIDSPRIVNGAQTTYAILNSEFHDKDSTAILIRLIAALPGSSQVSEKIHNEPEVIQDLYMDIARYTNSQNPIEMPDFRSNELVQKRLHNNFRSLGWFYEHRRGQLKNDLSRNDYLGKCIRMDELAQRWFAFDGNPAIAIREKMSLFDEQGHYNTIFMVSRSAEEYLTAFLLFDQLQRRLTEKIKKAKDEERASLETGSRISVSTQNYLMIGRATKLAVAHMVALLGLAIKERYGSFSRSLAQRLLPQLESNEFVNKSYPELEDALFRLATPLQREKYKTLHRLLSEKNTLNELYDLFKYVLEREIDKGRDPLALAG